MARIIQSKIQRVQRQMEIGRNSSFDFDRWELKNHKSIFSRYDSFEGKSL